MKVSRKIALGYLKTKLNLLHGISKKRAGEEAFRLFCTPFGRAGHFIHEAFRQAETLQFTLNNQKITGYRCNHPGTKKIVLLHGFSSCSQNFAGFVKPLTNKNFEVLAFDAPAHGMSEGDTLNALDYAAMIKKINQLYGPVDGYIAHSFGGISLALALEEIPHDENARVVLIAPATETSTAIDIAFRWISLRSPGLRKSIDDIILQKSGKPTEWFSIRRAVQNIRAKILWIHDEDDDITPLSDALKVKNDAPPNVTFMITQKLGHRSIYRDSGVLKQVIEFL